MNGLVPNASTVPTATTEPASIPRPTLEQAREACTPKQRLFAETWVANDFKSGRSYAMLHPDAKSPDAGAARMLRAPAVQVYADALHRVNCERAMITPQRVLAETARIAFSNVQDLTDVNGRILRPHELPRDVAASISEFTEDRIRVRTRGGRSRLVYRTKYKLIPKDQSLDRLAKYFNMNGQVPQTPAPNPTLIQNNNNITMVDASTSLIDVSRLDPDQRDSLRALLTAATPVSAQPQDDDAGEPGGPAAATP